MIFFLANKRIVWITEIKSFVCIHPVMRYWQLFEIMIAKGVPRRLLERMESDALITGIYIIAVGDFIVVQHRTAAAAAVFHRTQFRFLKTGMNNRKL